MVSIRIDLYRYREVVKQAIIKQIDRLNDTWDPFAASWLGYALSQDGFEANQPLLALVNRLNRWVNESEVWSEQRSLGALCFLGYFLIKINSEMPDFRKQVLDQIERLSKQKQHKFSPMNDPEQIFPMALFISSLEEKPQSLTDFLKDTTIKQMHGKLKRQVLLNAAVREMGGTIPLTISEDRLSDHGDIIAVVWFKERYGERGDCAKWWKYFENIKDGLSLELEPGEGFRVPSASEIAMLFEALTRETAAPDPNLLFELYPLHWRIKEIARKHFEDGNYIHAVFEAAKAFEEHLKKKTGIDKTCRPLVQESMGVKSPRIRFNDMGSESKKNIQEGLKLIAEGICAAFRNPKGHEPMDAPIVQIDALEALDQLAIISYILKRVDQAQVSDEASLQGGQQPEKMGSSEGAEQ